MKIKIGLFVGYDGSNYYGAQFQKEERLDSIMRAIINTLLKYYCIKESNSTDPKKIGMKCTSRTDKGVHALLNVFQCKVERNILVDKELYNNIKEDLGKKNIYLYKVVKITKSWLGHKSVSTRLYNYFIPVDVLNNEIKKFKTVFNKFKGRHSFHNFTDVSKVKVDFYRNIVAIDYSEVNYKNRKYLKINLTGNSFILHQIRKMVGTAICLTINSSISVIDSIFTDMFLPDKIYHTPLAPSEYLLLCDINFFTNSFKNTNNDIIQLEITNEEKLKFFNEFLADKIFNESNNKKWNEFFENFNKFKRFDYLRNLI
ncbi:YCG6 [Hepatospora eriocheir]|uniref:tRNA pseudouridine synthase n=1 Tax=Hepatospora eriocheir TaxID=1081669 RepID=A0A1X0QJJ7_9MICR|nr:YCG6 [Hepatospora eriocheir]